MNLRTFMVITALFCPILAGSEKPDFSGAWRMDTSDGQSGSVVKITQNDSELRISNGATDRQRTDVTCNTMGRQCEATVDGEPVKVSYWYNGPMLVEMKYEGKNNERITKTRRTLSGDAQKMIVEVLPIVPAVKSPEKLVFVRDQQWAGTAAATK